MKRSLTLLAALLAFAGGSVLAAEPTAQEVVAKYDAIMGPPTFELESDMTAWREDGTHRTYGMKMLKGENDKARIWFQSPAAVKGQEMLRVGNNLWVYLPNLKRATRLASRESFQGGDFNNADVLRVNYSQDYDARLSPSDVDGTWLLDLKSKNPETAYDAIKLWIRKTDWMPVKGQYFGTSGQMLRSAVFSDFTEYGKGYTRPARVIMQNEQVKARKSELLIKALKVGVNAPAQRFTQADLGR